MMKLLRNLLRDEDGPTAVEYAVMLALIVVACIGAVHSMANATADSFNRSANELDSVLGEVDHAQTLAICDFGRAGSD